MKCDCGNDIPITVCRSNAGYYIGRWCANCGPYNRLSGYYETEEQAKEDLHIYKSLSSKPFWQ